MREPLCVTRGTHEQAKTVIGFNKTSHFASWTIQGSNRTPTEQLVKDCQPLIKQQFENAGYFCLKVNELFYNAQFGNLFISSLAVTPGTQKTAQTVTWLCKKIILSIGHQEVPTDMVLAWVLTLLPILQKATSHEYPMWELARPLCFLANIYLRWCKLNFGPQYESGEL